MASPTISNFAGSSSPMLFNRAYSLAIGAPTDLSKAIQFSNQPSGLGIFQKPSSPLRIAFDIDRNLYGSSPNKAKIHVYNLQSQNRSKIQAGYVLKLQAGYQKLIDTIYLGNISLKAGVKNVRKGPDIITEFECGEGEAAIVMARLDKNYPPGTPLAAIISDLATAMMTGNNSATDSSVTSVNYSTPIPAVSYARGLSIHGPCKDNLTQLLKNQGLRWTIQNGVLNILALNSTVNPSQAIVVSSGVTTNFITGAVTFNPGQATGLIGIPSKSETFVTFTSLLNPNLKPGAYVQLKCEDKTLNGYYKINRAHYQGDTHDNKWHVICETVNPTPTLTGIGL